MNEKSEHLTNSNICVVVPAFNEEAVIGDVVRSIINCGFKNVIVVDDGSTDHTYDNARNAGAIAYRHRVNRGKGAAVKTGLMASKMRRAEIVVTMDGDGQHDPLDIDSVIEPILSSDIDVVLGTRMFIFKNISFYKVFANKIANILTRILTGIWVSDSQSGFRAFDARALDIIYEVGDKYEYDSEIIRQIARNSLKYKEVPIKVYYTDYSMKKAQKQGIINGLVTLYRLIWNIIS